MSNPVLLNNVDHQNLRVITTRSAAYGDAVMSCLTFPFEFRNVQAWYPILFQEIAGDVLRPVALFGFQTGENLFLDDQGWNAGYVPAMIRREPFQIGLKAADDPSQEALRMLSLDADHARVTEDETQGEALFQPLGGRTPFLEKMTDLVETVYQGLGESEAFVAALQAHNLIEQVNMDITLDDGSHNQLLGFHAIDEDKFRALPGDVLEQFSQQGFLMPAFLMMASFGSMPRLVSLKNRTLSEPGNSVA